MTNEPKKTCPEHVTAPGAWRSHVCGAKAVTPAGYCRTHDPDLAAARRKERGPTKAERQHEAMRKRDQILEDLLKRHPEERAEIDSLRRWIWISNFG